MEPFFLGGTMGSQFVVLLVCVGAPLLTAVVLAVTFLHYIRKTVQELQKANLDFFEDQTKRINVVVENQSRLMANLLESVADRLMSKTVDEFRGVQPQNTSTAPSIEVELSPFEEMQKAGLDPSNEDDIELWNSGADLTKRLRHE